MITTETREINVQTPNHLHIKLGTLQKTIKYNYLKTKTHPNKTQQPLNYSQHPFLIQRVVNPSLPLNYTNCSVPRAFVRISATCPCDEHGCNPICLPSSRYQCAYYDHDKPDFLKEIQLTYCHKKSELPPLAHDPTRVKSFSATSLDMQPL